VTYVLIGIIMKGWTHTMFAKTIRYLNNQIHPHPDPKERDLVIKILKESQGYLTKRGTGYVRVVFYEGDGGSEQQ